MSLLSNKVVVLLLTAIASLGALNAYAAKATPAGPEQKVSMLGDKLKFTLPKGFSANPLPASPTGASGTMYTNETTKTVVIVAENTVPVASMSRITTLSFSTPQRPTSPLSKPRRCRTSPKSVRKA